MNKKQCLHAGRMAFLGLVAGLVLWSTPVLAQDKAPRQGPCSEEMQKFCPDAKTMQERTQCLKSHEADLSQTCQDRLGRVRERFPEIAEACKGDAETLCKDINIGGGRLARCLKEHEAELSAACKDARLKGKGKTS